MLKLVLVVLLIVHGMIHFTGLIRAFLPAHVRTFTTYINKPTGIEWALAGTLFIVSGVLLGMDYERWWMVAGIALAFSQILIFFNWHDARFGTVANVILAVAVYFGAAIWDFQDRYVPADRTGEHARSLPALRISDPDPAALPQLRSPYWRSRSASPQRTFVYGRFT